MPESRTMDSSSNNLRIALLTDSVLRGGAQKQLVYMVKALHEANIEVRVYSFLPEGVFRYSLEQIGVPFIWLCKSNNPIIRLIMFIRQLHHYKPHIIQTAQLFTGIYAALAGIFVNAPSITSMRTDLARDTFGLGQRVAALSIRLPTALIVNSQKALEDVLSSKLAKSRFTYLLPNVIDLDDFDKVQPSIDDLPLGFRVVFVGRLTSVKRVDLFLSALEIAQNQMPNVVGIIVGDGPESETLLSQALARGTKVHFLGSRDDVPQILRSCHVLVLCSDYEGFPNVLIEAMAAQLPVITTPAGDSNLVVVDGETGYVVPFNDVEAMAERIVFIARNPKLISNLGSSGRNRVEIFYSNHHLLTNLLRIYSDLGHKDKDFRLLDALRQIEGESKL